MEEKNGERERERERIGCGAEMPSCEQEPSVNLGRMKEKRGYCCITLSTTH